MRILQSKHGRSAAHVTRHANRLADRTSLMTTVLGIKTIQPGTNGELKVVYDLGNGKTATLAIYSDAHKRKLTGASVGG